jgi:hypothetical protein
VWRDKWLTVANLLIGAAVLNLALRWIIRYSAAVNLGRPRNDGSYELLLTTPLGPSDIVWGELEALKLQFRPVGYAVLAIEILMMWAGLLLRDWTVSALGVYFALWLGLFVWDWRQIAQPRSTMLSMWASLNSAQPARAVWRCFGPYYWIMLWLWWIVLYAPRSSSWIFPSGNGFELFMIPILGVGLLAALRNERANSEMLESRLVSEFREIAREPLPDPGDPRFKQWQVRDRFPWGWEIIQQQLLERTVRRGRS